LLTVLGYAIFSGNWVECVAFIVMSGLIAWLGWQDDLHSLSPRIRFFVQTVIAIISVIFLGYFDFLHIPMIGEIHVGYFGIPLTILWIVGLTNAYNFVDGLDGFAGGQAVLVATGWIWISSSSGGLPNSLAMWISLAIAASSLGFLPHNWPRADIFMGDVASTFLGYSFAVLPLFSLPNNGNSVLVGIVLVWAILLDTMIAFVRRAIKHENLFAAHRTHLYQRWIINGVKPVWVNMSYYGFVLAGIFLLWGWFHGWPLFSALIIIGLPVVWFILNRLTRKWENDHRT
jgi:UDP-N-acetylmuramyl pentapeptide phosphotransferase/UDP-N-acetylglucosamine-1-phosphate transferase